MRIIIILLSVIVLIACQSTSTTKHVILKPLPQIEKSAHTPIVRIHPKYPLKAAKTKQNGWVHFTFDIDTKGKVKNIKLIDVSPKGFKFENNAYSALSKWRYKPVKVDGAVQDVVDQHVTLLFSVQR